MSFAEQVKQVTSSPEYKAGGDSKTAPSMAGGPGNEIPSLPTGGKTEAEIQAEQQANLASNEPPKPSKVKIGDKEFTSMEEAVRYAEQLEAKNKGINETLDKLGKKDEPTETTPQKSFEEEMEELIFIDPKEAVKKIMEKTQKDIFDKYNQMTETQKQEQARQAAIQAYEDNFYKANTDLSDFKEVVKFVEEKHWATVADMPLDKASEFVANKTREMLKLQKNASAKKQELSSGPAFAASSSGATPQATVTSTEKPSIDFVAQLNKIRKRSK